MRNRSITEEELEIFLAELFELCKKHSVEIAGCGCCGSPSIDPVDDFSKYSRYKAEYWCNDYGSGYSELKLLRIDEEEDYLGKVDY